MEASDAGAPLGPAYRGVAEIVPATRESNRRTRRPRSLRDL